MPRREAHLGAPYLLRLLLRVSLIMSGPGWRRPRAEAVSTPELANRCAHLRAGHRPMVPPGSSTEAGLESMLALYLLPIVQCEVFSIC